MEVTIISNQDEYSRTVARADGSRLDFVAYKPDREITIALVDLDGNPLQEITLSAQEARYLFEHLSDHRTLAILVS